MKLPPSAARRYEVDTVLASGGFGHVLRARDRELDRTVAIKVLTAAALSDPAQVHRFRDEGRITAALEHPHIVRVLDHGLEDGVPWIVYELLSGGTLRTALEKAGRFTPEAAVDATRQVAAALDAAHARGVLHRDVKPENVLAASATHWKLTDFGIARWAGREGVHTATGIVLGTPLYLAPDLVRGEPASPATDLYSLGVVLFELIAGAPPFQAETPLALIQQHLQDPPPLDRLSAPAPVLDLVARLLAKHARERPPTAARAMADLESALSASQGRPSRPSRLPSRTAATKVVTLAPRSTRAPLAALIALIALGALAFGVHRAHAPRPAASPAAPAARLAALKTAPEAGWDAEARALCRQLETASQVDELADLVRRRNGTLLIGSPPWTVELARARAKRDGSLQRVIEMDARAQRVLATLNPEGQTFAFACLVELHNLHGDGGGALLTWFLLSWSMSDFDRQRRLFYDGLKHAPARAEDEAAPQDFQTRYWLPIALGALEQPPDPVIWFKLTAVTHSMVESMLDERQSHRLRPVLDAVPALRASYPDNAMLDLLEADVAQAKGDLAAYRAAMQRGGQHLAALYLQKKTSSSSISLDCWSTVVNRLIRRSYALRKPELIDDAQREYERVVPAGEPPREPLPERVREVERLLKVCQEEAARRRR